MKKGILLSLLSLLVLAAALSQIDDKLDYRALIFLERIEPSKSSTAYFFLLGIDAEPTANPVSVGMQRFEQHRARTPNYDPSTDTIDANMILPLPEGPLYCPSWEEQCLQALFSSDYDISALFHQHEILLARAAQFYEFDEYRTLAKPSIDEPYPSFRYILRAERLNTLAAIQRFREEKNAAAINQILNRIPTLRKQFSLQDTLVGKLIFVTAISEVLDVASLMLANSTKAVVVDKIENLSESEKSFSRVSAREFALVHSLFQRLDKNPTIFDKNGSVPGWIVRILFKPNMSSNAVLPLHLRGAKLAQMQPRTFAEYLESTPDAVPDSSWLRNATGHILVGLGSSYDSYVAKIMDVDAKISLFNALYVFGKTPAGTSNPYYEDEFAFGKNGRICFRGPLSDEKNLRCLITVL